MNAKITMATKKIFKAPFANFVSFRIFVMVS
jgi:hypothetical protein